MAYVFPTPGDIPKKILSLPRVDFASSRFSCASNASGSGRSVSIMGQFYSVAALSPHSQAPGQCTILTMICKSIERQQIVDYWVSQLRHYRFGKVLEWRPHANRKKIIVPATGTPIKPR